MAKENQAQEVSVCLKHNYHSQMNTEAWAPAPDSPQLLLEFPESPKTQRGEYSPGIHMIRNSERQKVDGIRLKEASLSSEFFPRKKRMPKVGSMPHTLKQQKQRGDVPRESISGRNNHSRSQSWSLLLPSDWVK